MRQDERRVTSSLNRVNSQCSRDSIAIRSIGIGNGNGGGLDSGEKSCNWVMLRYLVLQQKKG